jgi:hypothetical protein
MSKKIYHLESLEIIHKGYKMVYFMVSAQLSDTKKSIAGNGFSGD